MKEIAKYIADGSMAFLKRQYRALGIIITALFIILTFTPGLGLATAICFVFGSVFSMAVGFFGMRVATKANVRTANATIEFGISKALDVAFSGGSLMGMCVAGLGILGIGGLYIIYPNPEIITGFSLGASVTALFARAGSGIFTKLLMLEQT